MIKESKTKKTKTSKKKESIIKKITKYFRGVGKEIKKIRWTSSKDMIKYSIAALSFIIFFCLYFYLIELGSAFIRSLV